MMSSFGRNTSAVRRSSAMSTLPSSPTRYGSDSEKMDVAEIFFFAV